MASMGRLPALVLLLSLAARAQEMPPPPPPEDAQELPRRPPVSEMGYYDACFGVPRVGAGPFGIYGEVPIGLGGGSSGGAPSLPIPSASSDDKAWLVVAVVAVAALPIVVYALDSPAPRIVVQRFRCPTFSLDLVGGAINGAGLSSGYLTTRFGFGVEHIAADFEYDGAPRAVSSYATHFVLRATPRAHVEGGLAIGYRRSVLDGRAQDGLEIGIPHRYALWRDELRTVALELRPFLMVGSQIEPSLEAAILVPLAQVLHLRVGGRVYTFGGRILSGFSLGLSIAL
jgi:hypothetical protein